MGGGCIGLGLRGGASVADVVDVAGCAVGVYLHHANGGAIDRHKRATLVLMPDSGQGVSFPHGRQGGLA